MDDWHEAPIVNGTANIAVGDVNSFDTVRLIVSGTPTELAHVLVSFKYQEQEFTDLDEWVSTSNGYSYVETEVDFQPEDDSVAYISSYNNDGYISEDFEIEFNYI